MYVSINLSVRLLFRRLDVVFVGKRRQRRRRQLRRLENGGSRFGQSETLSKSGSRHVVRSGENLIKLFTDVNWKFS